MEIIKTFNLGILFLLSMLMIVSIGILITNFFENKKDKKGIIYFVIVYFIFLARIILDTYNFFFENLELLFGGYALFFDLLLLIFISPLFYKLWSKLNKFSIFIIGLLLIANFGINFFSFSEDFFKIVKLLFFLLLNLFFYFLGIHFLIGVERKRVLKKEKFPKNRILILISFGVVFLILVGGYFLFYEKDCTEKLSSELNIYNWEDYFSLSSIENFEKEFGVKINLFTFKDEYLMFEEIQKNPEKYDIIIVSDDLMDDAINLNLLASVDKKNIPNLKYVNERCMNLDYNSKEIYGVPYNWGTTGVIINTKYIPETTNNFGVLWDTRYSGKIAVLNNPSEVIGMASKYIGMPLVPQNSIQLKEIMDFLLIQRQIIRGYLDIETIKDYMISEELWASQIYDGDGRTLMMEDESFKYFIPKEGSSQWVDNFAILKRSERKYTAELFINYILRPNVSAEISNYVLFSTCNKEAEKELNPEFFKDLFSKKNFERLEYFSEYNETDEMIKLKHQLWLKLIGMKNENN